MFVDLTYDNKFLVVNSDYPKELSLLKTTLTREIQNAWMLKKTNSSINTERCFINNFGLVPVNLWLDVIRFARECNIYCELSDKVKQYIAEFSLNFDYFKKYVDNLFKDATNSKGQPFAPREYQVKAAYELLKYKRSTAEISTSAGKTLISFIVFKFLMDCKQFKKFLYIVPSVDLANQSIDKYKEYESYLKYSNSDWSAAVLKANLKKKEKEDLQNFNILFGTYQSLCKKPMEFFNDFQTVIVDECHHATAKSIKNIIAKCINANYSMGVTGTFPKKETCDYLTLQSYIGPLVYKLTANDLINKEHAATPIYVVFDMLDWATDEEKQQLYFARAQKGTEAGKNDISLGAKLLKNEQKFINGSYTRLKYICDSVIKTKQNSLVLFGDVQGGYGQRIYDYIKDNSDKNAYYIDGFTDVNTRDYYKEQCANDKDGNTVIVGSIYTMGEGIDIPNLSAIFLVNTSKSERMIRQILGRGIRLAAGKKNAVLFDIVDDLRYSMDQNNRYYENYMWQHYTNRKHIYKEHNFPTYTRHINFE